MESPVSSLTVQDPIERLADARWPPPLELARSRRGSFRSALAAARAYVALTKPNIIWLLLITTVPAMSVADGGWPSTWLVVATLAGGMLTAGGANAINQYADRDIDALMKRTSGRPLPSGAVPARHAAILGVALAAIGTAWLALTVNGAAAALAVAAVVWYAVVYSYLLKRSTSQNIVIGGLAGAMPPLIGWTAVTGDVSAASLLLFLIVVSWTPPHFWALALLLADDYREAGVPMLPVVRGDAETARQILRYSYLVVVLTVAFWAVAGLSLIYLAAAGGGGAVFVWFALLLRRRTSAERARRLFKYSTLYLALLFGAMLADQLLLG
jgi:protoheme IX farnesyltransferase